MFFFSFSLPFTNDKMENEKHKWNWNDVMKDSFTWQDVNKSMFCFINTTIKINKVRQITIFWKFYVNVTKILWCHTSLVITFHSAHSFDKMNWILRLIIDWNVILWIIINHFKYVKTSWINCFYCFFFRWNWNWNFSNYLNLMPHFKSIKKHVIYFSSF